jgi:hypothetical protein
MLRPWLTLASILAAFAINTASNIVPIKGQSIGALSNTLFKDVLITPANYAFIIWGVIYVGLLAFGIHQLLPHQRTNPILDRIGYLITVSSIAQCIWVIVFQLRLFALSLVAMVLILLSLIAAYLQIHHTPQRQPFWFVQFPISIYLAWISVATVVNGAIVLYAINWNAWGLSPILWTIAMLIIATIIALIITLRYRDLSFVGVFIWAFVAIAIKHLNTPAISYTAGGFALFLLCSYGVRQGIQRGTGFERRS